MRKGLLILLSISSLASFAQGKKGDEYISKGNDAYNKQKYQEASTAYQQALNLDPNNVTARFNLANALYQQQQKVDAAKMFTGMLNSVEQKDMRAKIYYNKGVILSDQKNVEESIDAYKNALRNDPFDKDARENLQKALLELKKKQPPQKQENKENKKQQQEQKQQQQSKMNPKETQQKLQLLEQKEKQVQQRIQSEKNKGAGGSSRKDW